MQREASKEIDLSDWKVERLGGNVLIISGRTQSGLHVRASQGSPTIAASDGTFKLQVKTPLSEVALEFGDDRGNRTGLVVQVGTGKVLRRF